MSTLAVIHFILTGANFGLLFYAWYTSIGRTSKLQETLETSFKVFKESQETLRAVQSAVNILREEKECAHNTLSTVREAAANVKQTVEEVKHDVAEVKQTVADAASSGRLPTVQMPPGGT